MPTLLVEVQSQFQRRDSRIAMLGIWLGVALAGIALAARWSLWRIQEAASLIEAHEGYLGVDLASPSQASLMINLIERGGGPFVRRLSLARGTALIERDFPPANRLTHIDRWPALQRFEVKLPTVTIRADVIIATSYFLSAALIGAIASVLWLIIQAHRRATERRRLENLLAERLGSIAQQVAHDIRAPLAALDTVLQDVALSPECRMVANRAAARMRVIAEGVLREFRGAPQEGPADQDARGGNGVRTVEVVELIRSIANEKRAQYRGAKDLRLTVAIADASRALIVANPTELERVLSNLIDNSAQAMRGLGTLVIRFEQMQHGWLSISIEDSGPGIPPSIMSAIGQRGATFGKDGGSGLGLWHAKTTVESWGGRLEIQSHVGKGTTIRLILPQAQDPTTATADAILIDDDPLVRMSWTVAANRAGKTFKAYADVESFIREGGAVPKGTALYIDSDLGSGAKGEDVARRLFDQGFTELFLATGHDPASFPPLPHLKAIRGKEPPWPCA